MTDAQIFAAYIEREKAAAATPQGQDVEAIMDALALETGERLQRVRFVVAEFTIHHGAG
ncbi:MAG: hypothetical protein Tp176DCM1853251_18 [Prokaryotic dsDNA virus sp.]|nr:MAG: hypothetical protein Tp176DCM1853251_18 [Prokaryotic dsDNA virus sp.]|tara:strand:- start:2996 stop:3172 length:177 start_codon:yes stop_codon:yes gene_type:complete